jgi:hypothetical protein
MLLLVVQHSSSSGCKRSEHNCPVEAAKASDDDDGEALAEQ